MRIEAVILGKSCEQPGIRSAEMGKTKRGAKKILPVQAHGLSDPDSIFDYLTFRACRSKFSVCMPPADWPLLALVFVPRRVIGSLSACSTLPADCMIGCRVKSSQRTTNTLLNVSHSQISHHGLATVYLDIISEILRRKPLFSLILRHTAASAKSDFFTVITLNENCVYMKVLILD